MKTIKLFFLLAISILLSANVFAQDEFYNEESKESYKTETFEVDTIFEESDIDNYSTERDYQVDSRENSIELTLEEEIEIEEKRKRRQRRNRAEFVAEVFFDVVVNAAFVIAAFWQ